MQRTMTRRGSGKGRNPEVFYGYCYRTQGMRMMTVDDYLCNLREGYTQIQAYTQSLYGVPDARRSYYDDCGCDCDPCGHDSCCDCCICDGDVLIEARCSERRVISLTFSNDSRRTRDVTVSLSSFSTASGRDLGWAAALSDTKFTLGPCEEKVVQLVVNIDCSVFHKDDPASTAGTASTAAKARKDDNNQRLVDVDRCEVAYARVSAEGCISRPVLVAVAVLPNHCDSYVATCKCDCC